MYFFPSFRKELNFCIADKNVYYQYCPFVPFLLSEKAKKQHSIICLYPSYWFCLIYWKAETF